MSKRGRRPPAGGRNELAEFKGINLSEFAASYGYQLDPRSSSRNSATMAHPAGDKIIVARSDKDGHWIYFSVRDEHDNGSIIDFIQKHEGGTLADVRERLRPWLAGTVSGRPAPETFAAALDPVRKDLIGVRRAYETMRPIDGHHAYLEDVRKIPPHLLTDPLFADRIRTDDYGNAVFPHFNRDGLCGFERRGASFRGFAAGAVKGLWFSQIGREDRRLVIAESAIDALSYAGLRYEPATRYVSIAGELSPDQIVLLRRSMEKLPPSGQVVLAVDHDAGGTKIGSRIEAVFGTVSRSDLVLAYDRPAAVDADWNDELTAKRPVPAAGPALPPPRPRRA